MSDCNFLGVDLAKSSFQIHQASRTGKVLSRKQLNRLKFTEFLATSNKATIFMEACAGANFWARKAKAFGHEVKLIAPQYVKPFVRRQKNDAADAEGICDAGMRENMRFVPVKAVAQQDLQALHRIRDMQVGNRTALYNQVRGILLEYGIAIPKTMSALRKRLCEISLGVDLGRDGDLSPMMRDEMRLQWDEIQRIDQKVADYDKKIGFFATSDDRCKRLMKVPGIGPITATAIVAAVGNAGEFRSSRQFSAWLGLVPRQHSTGGKTRLMGLSKQGNKHLRMLLIHGGRAVLMNAGNKKDPRSIWADNLMKKVGMNKAAVAMANKNARTVWALLSRQSEYKPNYRPAMAA
jgi:transposase